MKNAAAVLSLISLMVFSGCLEPSWLYAEPDESEFPIFNPSEGTGSNEIQNTAGLPQIPANNAQTLPEGSGNKSRENYESTVSKEKGESNGLPPYAEIDFSGIRTRRFDFRGGVLEAGLSNEVKLFVVVPPEEVIMTARITIIPFKKMPSTSKHPVLSNELGYGALVTVDSVQMGVNYFAVFDLENGNARQRIAAKKIPFDRCDPKWEWFNPFVCSHRNNSFREGIEKNYAVITPVFSGKQENVSARNIIPIGVQGLLAVEGKGNMVLVPQKLDQALAAEIAKSSFKANLGSMELVEAGEIALAWNIPLTYDEMDDAEFETVNAETYQQMIEALYALKKFKAFTQSQADTESEEWSSITNDAKEVEEELKQNIYADAESDSTSTLGSGYIEGAAAAGIMKEENIPGSEEAGNAVERNLTESIREGAEQSSQADEGAKAGEALGEVSDNAGSAADALKTTTENVMSSPDSAPEDVLNAWAAAQAFGLDTPEMEQMAKDALLKSINEIINNPDSGIYDLLKALELAQQMGLDSEEMTKKAMDKIREKIEEMLENDDLSKMELLELAGLSQMLGFNDLADKAMAAFNSAPSEEEDCEALVKKTLANYGMNECS